MDYTFNKEVNIEKLTNEIKSDPTIGSYILGCSEVAANTVVVHSTQGLSSSEENILTGIIDSHTIALSQAEQVRQIVANAISFGESLIFEFTIENVLLGITQLGLTSHVRQVTKDIITALQTGSLYDAISLVRVLDSNDFDSTILTPERLLFFRNKIETYLGIPLASTWDE